VLEDPSWNGAIAVAMGGEGSVAANGFWAALNIVTTMWYPYLFIIDKFYVSHKICTYCH
jgi:2-oxoisovalerate dehydrogenase E1 component